MNIFVRIIFILLFVAFPTKLFAENNPYKKSDDGENSYKKYIENNITLAKNAKPENMNQVQRLEYEDYIITNTEYDIPIEGKEYNESFKCISIQKDQHEVYNTCSVDLFGRFWLPEPTDIADITGDNIPDLVITEYTGGASCCWMFNLFRLGDQFKFVQLIDNGMHEVTNLHVVKEDGVSASKIPVTNSDYGYFQGSAYNGPHLSYWLTGVGDHFEIPLESLAKPPLTKEEFASAVADIKNEEAEHIDIPKSGLRLKVIELATSGNLAQALQLAEKVLPLSKNPDDMRPKFLKALVKAPYESSLFREYVFLNLSGRIRQVPNNIVPFPSGIVLEQAQTPDKWQYLPGVRATADTNYFSYQGASVSLHTVQPSSQKVGDVVMKFAKSEAGWQTANMTLTKQPPVSVPQSFTMAHVNAIKAANEQLLNSAPEQQGVYEVPSALQQSFKTDCPAATYAVHVAQKNYKTYKTLKVSLPSNQNFYVPWGALLEHLSCQPDQPVVVGILACRTKGNCGQLVSSFK